MSRNRGEWAVHAAAGWTALLAASCGASSDIRQISDDSGGGGESETSGGAGGASPVTGTISMHAATVDTHIEYTDIELQRSSDGTTETLTIAATILGEDGAEGTLDIIVPGHPEVGAYSCEGDAVVITTHLLCCPFTYYSRNTEPRECRLNFTEVSDTKLVGTFDGLLYDKNGGRLIVRDGNFDLNRGRN